MMSLFEATGLEDWCHAEDRDLRNAFEESHLRGTIHRPDHYKLTRSAANQLLAVNAYSRINVSEALCNEVADRLCVNEHWEHRPPIFFTTIIPTGGFAAAEARGIDLNGMKQRLRVDFSGISYLGAFEPGYYASLPIAVGKPGIRAISWHAHLLMWGISTADVAQLVRQLQKGGHYRAVVKEMQSVHVAEVANGELPKVVGYMLKPPSHAYRVQRYTRMKGDEMVLKRDGTPEFWVNQRSSMLGHIDRLRVFHAMKHLGLDDLIVGGGEGSAMRTRAFRGVEAEFVRQETNLRSSRKLGPRRRSGAPA
jgi:hypothetical protein